MPSVLENPLEGRPWHLFNVEYIQGGHLAESLAYCLCNFVHFACVLADDTEFFQFVEIPSDLTGANV